MKLTLLSQSEYTSFTLPQKVSGHYWLRGWNADGKMTDIACIDAVRSTNELVDDYWVIKSNRRYEIIGDENKTVANLSLHPLELYRIYSTDKRIKFTLFTEPVTLDRRIYRGYEVLGDDVTIRIGREKDNNISYKNNFVSGYHAELYFSKNNVILKDLNSTNNTYVNGKAVSQQTLKIGDVVFILGMQIIIAGNLIYINNPDGNITVNSRYLREYYAPKMESEITEEEFEELPSDYYYRAPRFKHDVDIFELKVDPPPENQDNDEMPMIMVIGPSMTMGMAAAASGAFAVTSAMSRGDITSAIPSIIMCCSMLLGTLMWPLVTKTYQKRLKKRKEAKRQESYSAYITQLEQSVISEMRNQELILRVNDLDAGMCASKVLAKNPQIWERTPKHTDFLCLRLGNGFLPLKADIKYPERKFTIEHDNLVDKMYEFCETERRLTDVPIRLPLVDRYIDGIYAEKSVLYSFARYLILQIVSLHSYDEVKLVMLYDESDEKSLDFVRWLPHTMNNEKTIRYIATNSEEIKILSNSLSSIIESRNEMSESNLENELPYFVVLCLDKELASKAEFVRRLLDLKKNIKFSVLSIFEHLEDLPKECQAVVEIKSGAGAITFINDVSEPPISFSVDRPQKIDIKQITNVLSNTFVNLSGSDFVLPKKYTFMEMLDIGMIEHLNLSESWATHDPTKSLAASVGIDKFGELFKLDLHERAHGPHGLVAGMTGSGKSEFIISYILSMATSFHPYEVAFILIDYKGGGMAKSFENIPHVAGIITNLDGNGIQRSLASMRSELHRRETIFRDTSLKYNISNIDIYKYQKLYREGKVVEPLPHLFIISDEFAELKKEQPDFMTELTSTARVGRSLGVHLILATQKPGGVVDDQIRSNSRFKVCLKVQDSGDSVEMLGRPDAAALVETGRFYLQVGYNEIFEIGQSAWAGAPYYPSSKVIKDMDDAVSVIDKNGRVVAEANINRFAAYKDPPKQIDVITDYIRKYCDAEKIVRWKMWLDPIPSRIYVDELAQKYNYRSEKFILNPIIGEYDDPSHQSQGLLTFPITEEGNALVYGSAGSGKTMFIEAICYALMHEHSPKEVNIYLLDFGAETLTAFAGAPHVGDVILSDETEKVNNLFKLMIGKMETRKKMLSRFGGSMTQYNKKADSPEPSMIVIINNFAAFNEMFEEKIADLSYLTREGTKYGIFFIITCTGVNNVKFSLLQNFKRSFCLQLNNPDDYSTVVGKTGGLYPSKYEGRGIFRADKDSLYEFQIANITGETSSYDFISKYSDDLAKKYNGKQAVRVPILPENVSEEFMVPYVQKENIARVPIGVEKSTLEISYYNFDQSVVTLVLSTNHEWQSFIDALGNIIASYCNVNTVVLSPNETNKDTNENEALKIVSGTEDCVCTVNEIFDTVLQRNNEYKETLANNGALPQYESLVVIIKSFSQLRSILNLFKSPTNAEKEASDDTPLNRLLIAMEKCRKEYNVRFIVAESISNLTPSTADSWYRTHISGNNGIWVGNGISSQFRFNINKKPAEYSSNIEDCFGFVINNAMATLVKLLQKGDA